MTLVIYDNAGTIYFIGRGVAEPQGGLNFLWVDVPEGKEILHVDTTGETPVAVLADLPKTETQLLMERIAELEDALCEISMVLE